jgi:hypothetical protein
LGDFSENVLNVPKCVNYIEWDYLAQKIVNLWRGVMEEQKSFLIGRWGRLINK